METKKITLVREDTAENIITLAVLKGYQPMIEEVVETETPEIIADPENPEAEIVEEVAEESEPKMIPNPQSAESYLAEVYRNIVDKDIKETIMKAKRRELRERQKAEERMLEEAVSQDVDANKTQAEVE